MKLHNKQFYNDNFDKDDYLKAQIKRHAVSVNKKRKESHYFKCFDETLDLIQNDSSMVCLGTRNNHERDVWRKALKSKNVMVYSLDISSKSKADYIMDFNCFPESWNDKWNIVFSNSIDHSIDATDTFYKWLSITKQLGIMIIGFDNNKNVTPADCCGFDSSTVDDFMKQSNDKFEFLKFFEISYKYYVLRKK